MLLATPPALWLQMPTPTPEEPDTCTQCGDETPDADTARDHDGWVMDEDGALWCEDCWFLDRPTGPYDRAYYG